MEHLTEKIQDYIEGKLQAEELAEFENYLKQDAELRNLVNLQKEVNDILNRRLTSDEADLRDTLFHAENAVRYPQKSLYQRMKPFVILVSAACVLIIGYLFLFSPQSDLYNLPTMQSEIVRGQEANEQYEEAVKLYNQQSYGESREVLNTLIEKEPTVVQYQYYAALTYLGDQKWQEGSEKLRTIAEGKSVFKDEAKYYLAISLDKQGKTSEALSLLKTISNRGEIGNKAQKLIEKLD